MTRPTWDDTWFAVTRAVAQRSLCDRDKVGAVVVSKSNRLLETGYNGPPAGFKTDDTGCSSWCTRAQSKPTGWEVNSFTGDLNLESDGSNIYLIRGDDTRVIASDDVLRRHGFTPIFTPAPDYSDCPALHAEANALMRGDRTAREGGTIYITSGVCFNCAKLIANSGLELVMVDPVAPASQHRNCEKSYAFLESCGVTVVTG